MKEKSENNIRNLDKLYEDLRLCQEKNRILIKLIEECGLGYKIEDSKKD